MSSKDLLIQHLHELYRNDPYINALYNSIGLEMNKIKEIVDILRGQIFFDQLTEDVGIPLMEKLLSFKTDPNSSLDDRHSQLEARYKSRGKFSVDLIQAICNSWVGGDTDVSFIDDIIKLTFLGRNGISHDLDNIYKAIKVIKPAQIPIDYELISITDMNLYFGTITFSGETVTVYPWNNKEIETTGIVTIGSAPAINAETTTIYPREGLI